MPLYEVKSLDVWGNARDGYEINNQWRIGEVYLRPTDIAIDAQATSQDAPLIEALVQAGFLGEFARQAHARGEIQVEVGEEDIQISETVIEEVPNEDEGDDQRNTMVEEAEKPMRILDRVRITWNEGLAEPFWSSVEPVMGYHGEDYELHIRASFMIKVNKWQDGNTKRETEVPIIIFDVKPMIHGEPTAEGGPDSFQFFFKDWARGSDTGVRIPLIDRGPKNHQHGFIGFDPISGEPITLSKGQIGDLLVSLDKFMEEGPAPTERYYAQIGGPQSGYAYEIEVPVGGRWNETDPNDWRQVVIDRDDLGEEVGVVVVHGIEMRVWKADEL